MTVNKNKPSLRFSEFTDSWEQRKLEKIASFSKGSGYSKSDLSGTGTPVILYGRLYTNYETVISNVDTYTEEKKGSVFSKGGEVIVPASGETAEDISIASVVEKSGVLLGGDLNVITPNKELESMFLALNITYGKSHKDMSKLAQGKSVVHLHNADLKTIDILYPSIPEQKKICEFFKSLDNLITLHQRKLENTQNIKKSCLQKMFPQNGENIPEIRFPGFSSAWEQRKLSDVAQIIGGGTPSTNTPEYWDGDIDWYAPAEINDQIYVDSSERKITKLGLEKSSAKILPAEKTVLFTSRAGIGKTAILRRPAATNQGFQSIVLNDETDTYFVYSMTPFIKEKAEKIASGSTFAEVSGKMLGGLSFMFPSKREQQKIGTFFFKLDNLITLHQRKLANLQNIKKGLLQQMFI